MQVVMSQRTRFMLDGAKELLAPKVAELVARADVVTTVHQQHANVPLIHARIPNHGVVTLEYVYTLGRGATEQEAIADWERQLPKGNFELLIWRVPPEIDVDVDFCTKELKWQVFARFAVAKKADAA